MFKLKYCAVVCVKWGKHAGYKERAVLEEDSFVFARGRVDGWADLRNLTESVRAAIMRQMRVVDDWL